jgi:hypothetical protein
MVEACHKSGCPVCRLEQQSVERYLDNQFYENVNSPNWRDGLRASLGFCHEHAWLGINQRLGDALGYSIIYHDLVNSILAALEHGTSAAPAHRRRTSLLRQLPESARNRLERILDALSPHKRCPVCEHRDHATRTLLSALVAELGNPEMLQALTSSDGLCLPHLRSALEHIKDQSASEQLLQIHRGKLESLRIELSEFIRKNDYQAVKERFGKEGDAWLRAVAMLAGRRKEK